MSTAKTISVTNQKGGVGKTTTTVNLAASMAATNRRVLLIDLDPQGNATMGSGVDKRTIEKTAAHILLDESAVSECIVPDCKGGYDMIPGNEQLTIAEVQLLDTKGREFKLRKALQQVINDYDYIFIDCPIGGPLCFDPNHRASSYVGQSRIENRRLAAHHV